jgi:hypothetical protein
MSKKSEAIEALMREARSERAFTQTSISRVSKACRALELNRAETISIFCFLDACNASGFPHRSGYDMQLPKE